MRYMNNYTKGIRTLDRDDHIMKSILVTMTCQFSLALLALPGRGRSRCPQPEARVKSGPTMESCDIPLCPSGCLLLAAQGPSSERELITGRNVRQTMLTSERPSQRQESTRRGKPRTSTPLQRISMYDADHNHSPDGNPHQGIQQSSMEDVGNRHTRSC